MKAEKHEEVSLGAKSMLSGENLLKRITAESGMWLQEKGFPCNLQKFTGRKSFTGTKGVVTE